MRSRCQISKTYSRDIMKKLHLIIAAMLLLIGKVSAQVPNLVVERQFDPNSSGIYEYKGLYNNKPYWIGPKQMPSYAQSVIYFGKQITNWLFMGNQFGSITDTSQYYDMYRSDQSTTSKTYPTEGWNGLKVSIEGPSLKFSQLLMTENTDDNGIFNDIITIRHNKLKGQGFAGTAGTDLVANGAVKVDRVPAGITAIAQIINDSTVDFVFDGSATNHSVDTSIIITFTDAAFTNGGKSDSTANSSATIKLNFIKSITVAKSGGDYTTLTEGFSKLEDGDVIRIKEGIYTEDSLKTPMSVKNLTILGDGPDKTILQSDVTPFTAKTRVLDIGYTTKCIIDGITIQNGNDTRAGGINGGQLLEINNCRILNNRAYISTGPSQTVAGGIYAGNIIMTNCEVVGNIADNSGKNGQVYGGGIAMQDFRNTHRIENSTFAKNYSRIGGAAIGNFMGNLEVINCTITENQVDGNFDNAQYPNHGVGGGIWSQDSMWIINTICWNNKGTLGKDIYVTNGIMFTESSIIASFNNSFKDTTKNISGTYKTINPKLDTLAFNCSVTRTFALLDGSPALDSASDYWATPTKDQRGFEVINARDIGAHETNNIIRFELSQDTICIEETELVYLTGYPNSGVFTGEGVNGNTFDVTKIKSSGYVPITYKFSAPGCSNMEVTDSIYVKVCTPNAVRHAQLPVSIYPNPASSELMVSNLEKTKMDIRVTDISGRLVLELNASESNTTLNIASLKAGVYGIEIYSAGKVAHSKFIKQ